MTTTLPNLSPLVCNSPHLSHPNTQVLWERACIPPPLPQTHLPAPSRTFPHHRARKSEHTMKLHRVCGVMVYSATLNTSA